MATVTGDEIIQIVTCPVDVGVPCQGDIFDVDSESVIYRRFDGVLSLASIFNGYVAAAIDNVSRWKSFCPIAIAK